MEKISNMLHLREGTMPDKHRRRRRQPVWSPETRPISIRMFTRQTTRRFFQMDATGTPSDADKFARMVDEQVQDHPRDPLVIAINGYEAWLGDILRPCINDYWNEISELDREVQFANTMQFPSRRGHKSGQYWPFILEHLNVPQVYYWSVGMDPPGWEAEGLPSIEKFRFRTGVWMSGHGACRYNDHIPVVIIFTRPTELAEHIVKELLFDYLHRDEDLDQPREDEEGICWTFSRLYNLLSDWQNIVGEIMTRLEATENNSKRRHLPVKIRTRQMHNEIALLYNLKEYLHFHTRAFKKLQKLKQNVPPGEQKDLLWDDMDDAVEDLAQFDTTLDGMKDRFNNLIELEFNITNATQSENSQFLSSVATLFLPLSFLSSLFGITTSTWPVAWYMWAAVPVFVVSLFFTIGFPLARRQLQAEWHAYEDTKFLRPNADEYTMLGEELPDNVDAPSRRPSTAKRSARRSKRFKRHAYPHQ